MNKAKSKKPMDSFNVKFVKFDFSQKQYLDLAMKIRVKVFVHEQKVPYKLEYDGDDALATHCLMFVNKKPVGTFRYRETDDGIKLERFAIKKSKRSIGFGRQLIEYALKETHDTQKSRYLYAQTSLLSFYRELGFEPIGERFMDAGIEHIKMIYKEKNGK